MRRRLTLTIVGLVTGALLLAGGGALLVASATARHDAVTQLVNQAEATARNASAIRTTATLRLLGRAMRLDRAVILVVGPSGRVVATVPRLAGARPLPPLPTAAAPRSGVRNDVAYALVPVRLRPSLAGRLPVGSSTAILLTRRVGALVPDWGFFVVVTAATALVAAAIATVLARRITRPLAAASDVTGRIAAGELGARLPLTGGPPDELDSLAHSINAMAASLEQSRRRETELLASVSHDLRTPLTSIRGYAEAIADDVAGDPRRAARIIGDQADRLERLVGDLLDLAKLRARHLPLHPAPVDLMTAITQAVDAVEPEARRLGVSIEHRALGANAIASADPDRVAQVLANLVQNAVAHAASTVVVRAGAAEPAGAGQVWIAVDDDGPGIPAGELERVFDRFYRLDRGRTAGMGGSGLGLSIVAELVSAMGGWVRAQSPASADAARPGSRFVVILPAAAHVASGSGTRHVDASIPPR